MKKAIFTPLCLALLLILFAVAYENAKVEEKAVEVEEETPAEEIVEELSEKVHSTEIEEIGSYIRDDLLAFYDLKMAIPKDLQEIYGWTTGDRFIFSPVYGIMLEIASVVPAEEMLPYNIENIGGILDRRVIESENWQGEVYQLPLSDPIKSDFAKNGELHFLLNNGEYKIHAIAYSNKTWILPEMQEIYMSCLETLQIRESLIPKYGDIVLLARNMCILEEEFSEEKMPAFSLHLWYAALLYDNNGNVEPDFVYDRYGYSKQETVETLVMKYFDVRPEDIRADSQQYDPELQAYKLPSGLGGFAPGFQIANAVEEGDKLKLQIELYNEYYEMYCRSELLVEVHEDGSWKYISNVVIN